MLLCNPFGEEAARAHRIYRVLATQLERAGFATLRFDYAGTGDSMGEAEASTLAGWVSDVGLAADELAAASGAKKLVAIGLRLGGTLAALATSRGRLRLRHLVMWDPVVDGAAYLRELAALHRRYLRAELGAGWVDRLPVRADGVPREALGTPIGDELAAEVGGLDLAAEELRAEQVTVISTAEDAALGRLRERLPPPTTRWIALARSEGWNSDAALNAQVVPADAVQAIVARVEEVSP